LTYPLSAWKVRASCAQNNPSEFMTNPFITSSELFAIRAQRSDTRRVVLWMGMLIVALVITLVRRCCGDVVMNTARVYFPFVVVLSALITYQTVLLTMIRSANRLGHRLPDWLWQNDAIINIGSVLALATILEFLSPSGPLAALSAPMILLLPIVSVQSVLRLRPSFTLYGGLIAAGFHLLLTIRAILVARVAANTYAFYFSYSCMLAMIVFACAFVSHEIRARVRETVDESRAREQSELKLLSMQRELAVAREIQQGLLPVTAPVIEGFEITAMNRPADLTGGDYYDWQELSDERLAVALADVSGHGMGPALLMAVCRAYARSTATTAPSPSIFLSRLNELLHGDVPAGRFITFVMAVLSPDGSTSLISAGHGPTLLFRKSTGLVTLFNGDGIPLAINSGESYGPTTLLSLEPGDVLVMLTDGFFEWMRPDDQEQFGIARLQETLVASAHLDASAILRALDDAVCQFGDGSAQPDDMTAIVIKRTGAAVGAIRVVDDLCDLVQSHELGTTAADEKAAAIACRV
jgi:serine phosphatase RsbU (regulator of sigma subunit)